METAKMRGRPFILMGACFIVPIGRRASNEIQSRVEAKALLIHFLEALTMQWVLSVMRLHIYEKIKQN